jgi:basic membrane lipoprotein Med (substrate-binding protein (PBP1-ABC) superfamily)
MITKTAIGNYLRKQPSGDVSMYRNGFKDGVAWAQKRLAGTPPQMRKATRDEKVVNPGVYEVPLTTHVQWHDPLPDSAI